MPRVGRALREHRAIMAAPFVPRTLADEERAGYEAGRSMRGLPAELAESTLAAFDAEAADPNLGKAARARGLARGLREVLK